VVEWADVLWNPSGLIWRVTIMGRQDRPLVVVLLAVGAGIAADRWGGLSIGIWLAAAAAGFGFWWLLRRSGRDAAAVAALAVALIGLGGAWHHWRWHYFATDEIGLFARELRAPCCLQAEAVTGSRTIRPPPYDPLRSLPPSRETRLTIAVQAIRDGLSWRSASGEALLIAVGDLPEIHAGDRLEIFGHLEAPGVAGNPDELDPTEFARTERRLASVHCSHPAGITIVQRARGWSVGRAVADVRSFGDRTLWSYLSHERAGLAAAVLLGERDELDPQRVEPFLLTGTIHVMVVAGLHVGILAFLLFQALRMSWIPRRLALAAVALTTLLYALVADAEPPVMRATVLVWVVCGSLWFGRGRLALNSLALAGLLVLALNPTDLFRVGTQLSFLAMAGLAVFGPLADSTEASDPLRRLIARSRPQPIRLLRRGLMELRYAAWVGLTIWLVTLPLVMSHFHLAAPVAVLLSPLVIVPMTLAMASGFGVLLLGAWLAPAAKLCAAACDWNLGLLEGMIAKAAAWGPGHLWVPGPRGWWLAGIYLILGAAILELWPVRRKPSTAAGSPGVASRVAVPTLELSSFGRFKWSAVLLATWCAIGFGVAWLLPLRGKGLDCTFVSVGHGCAVVVELPGGKVLLSDAGRLGAPLVAAREISGCLWSRGLTHIDAVVLSHNDIDHFNALPELLRRFTIGAVYVSPVMFNRHTGALDELRNSISRAGVPLREISLGGRLASGDDAQLEVLHPPPQGMGQTENADSIVLAVRWRGRRVLLTGDLAPPGLELVVARPQERYDVAMVPHHGSPTSDPEMFATWCRARFAVISGDLEHDSRRAIAAYRAAGSEVLDTGLDGAVHFCFTPDGGLLPPDCYRRGGRW